MRPFLPFLFVLAAPFARGQFVSPWDAKDHVQKQPVAYVEDPFVTEYRQKFFALFRGDVKTFEGAYAEIGEMLRKDPKDARALVWLGNGQTIKAIQSNMKGKKDEAQGWLDKSRKSMDDAVKLRPKDYNIYMMRAATLYLQAQYLPGWTMPRSNWEKIRDDCKRLIDTTPVTRQANASIHVKGETYGELGIAYVKLGDKKNARKTFQKLIEMLPGTPFAERAAKELKALDAG
jgi:tetratricopeptide (TPR) repeat protein